MPISHASASFIDLSWILTNKRKIPRKSVSPSLLFRYRQQRLLRRKDRALWDVRWRAREAGPPHKHRMGRVRRRRCLGPHPHWVRPWSRHQLYQPWKTDVSYYDFSSDTWVFPGIHDSLFRYKMRDRIMHGWVNIGRNKTALVWRLLGQYSLIAWR